MSWIIRLQHLPLSANAADIRAFFAGLRIPDGAVHIVGGADGDAFIGFATDEDARQAMTYDQRRIHDQRVRLFLSSRVEMESVIAKARAGELGGVGVDGVPVSPRAEDAQSLLARQIASASSEYLQRGTQQPVQAGPDLFGLRSSAARSGNLMDANRQPDYNQQDYSRGGNVEGTWGRAEPQSESWKSGNQNSYETRSSARPATVVTSQLPVTPWQNPKMLNVLSQNGTNQGAASLPVYQQAGREERFNQYEQDVAFQGYNASLQPSTSSSGFVQAISSSGDDSRRIVAPLSSDPTVAAAFQQNAIVSTVLATQSFPAAAGLIMPPALPNQIATSSPSVSVSQPAVGITAPISFPSFPNQSAPIFPPVPIRRVEKTENFYVELSRLPNELLRPSALEQFLRPTVPLTLSSVKVVFDPNGCPLHSLVRFENGKDAENVLSRDGEQGIRIRECTKEMFDTAVDGSVLNLANSLPYKSGFKGTEREREDTREVSQARGSRTHFTAERRDLAPRRDDRAARTGREQEARNTYRQQRHGRPRSPAYDYHEPKRRREEFNRFCVEYTNLPFRVTESEIRQYFGPMCEPTKVTRAFYEDGKPSDRWVVEFPTEDLGEKAFRMRGKIQDRLLRARRLTEEEADTLLAIPDKFGMQRREEYERKQASAEASRGSASEYDTTSGQNRENYSSRGSYKQGQARESVGLLGGPPGSTVSRNANQSAPAKPLFPSSQSSQNSGVSKASAPPNRYPTPRHSRANGPLLQGTPRPPLIPPPTFFGAAPSSNIKQRGPPPPSTSTQSSASHGPRASAPRNSGAAQNGTAGYASKKQPPNDAQNATQVKKTCIVLANVPDTASDGDLAQFLRIHSSRINDKTRRRMLDGSVYIDLANAEDALRAASKCNRQQLGKNCILVTAITRERMLEGLEKKVAFSEQKEIEPDVIASVGPPGTVISCHGFPPDITLNDVMQFFDKYSLVENSVRIKLDDSGSPTGECLLAVGSPQDAAKAVMLLSGRRLNGSTVTMTVVKTPSV